LHTANNTDRQHGQQVIQSGERMQESVQNRHLMHKTGVPSRLSVQILPT
jgi:hypothetical protein